jgi:hypothetical protein
MPNVVVNGSNPIETDSKVKSLQALEKLSAKDLEFLVKLKNTQGAIDGIRKNEKTLLMFLK